MSRNQTILNASITRALITAMGMQAENFQRQQQGYSMAYDEDAFLNIIDSEGIGYNNIITLLNEEL